MVSLLIVITIFLSECAGEEVTVEYSSDIIPSSSLEHLLKLVRLSPAKGATEGEVGSEYYCSFEHMRGAFWEHEARLTHVPTKVFKREEVAADQATPLIYLLEKKLDNVMTTGAKSETVAAGSDETPKGYWASFFFLFFSYFFSYFFLFLIIIFFFFSFLFSSGF